MKLWQKIGIGLLLSILLGYVGFAIFTFSTKTDKKDNNGVIIRIVDEEERQFITSKDIKNSLERNNISLDKKAIEKINITDLEKAIKKNPIVRRVECYKTPAGAIKIDVWQRKPIFRVMGILNYYVDENGVAMPITPNFTAHVPIVTGEVNKQFATQDLYKFVLFLQGDKFWNAQIEQIYVDSTNEIILIPRVGNHEIILGELNDFEKKLKKLKTLYTKGFNKIGWGNYESINLKYKNQVICTKRIGE
jgi:cell division protein FtsQ